MQYLQTACLWIEEGFDIMFADLDLRPWHYYKLTSNGAIPSVVVFCDPFLIVF